MHMWYWFGYLNEFLFKEFNVTTTWGVLSICLGLTALAIVYEAMKILQVFLRKQTIASLPHELSMQDEKSSLLSKISSRYLGRSTRLYCSSYLLWLLEVFHFTIHTTLGYFLMLAVMTYNVYVNIALVMGAGIGYFILGPTLVELNMAQYNNKRKDIKCNLECSDAILDPNRRQSTVSIIAEQLVTEANIDVDVQGMRVG
ncbi:probable low affinity copper uptake protein 2 isoform X2 [Cephus cinctus]|nr:probable low affinity copper uptake protein 2 isoform X2 [Cephus cinctus]